MFNCGIYVHVGSRDATDEAGMNLLRNYGIRTASDLEIARDAAEARDSERGRGDDELKVFLSILNPGEPLHRLETVLDTLKDDQWMENIRVLRKTRFRTDVLKDPSALS